MIRTHALPTLLAGLMLTVLAKPATAQSPLEADSNGTTVFHRHSDGQLPAGVSPQALGGTCAFGQPAYGASCQHTNGNIGILAGLAGGVLGVQGNTFGLLGGNDYGVVGQHADGHLGRLGTSEEGVYGQHADGNVGRLGTPEEGVYGENANGTFGRLGHEFFGVSGGSTTGLFGVYGYLGSTSSGALGTNDGNYGQLGAELYGAYGYYNNNFGFLGGDDYGAYGAYNNGNHGSLGGSFYGARGWNANNNRGYLGHDAYGVWGTGTPWAGYFQGDVHVTGTLTQGSAAAKIDHPLDPANRYLSHSFVESPERKNIYAGTIVTDGNGEAVVELPVYVEALNRDFRYQLTVLGQFAQALVAEAIQGHQFVIRTDAPGVEVSWQVTGIRHDPWAEAHHLVVEKAKPAGERGFFLHPQLYGQPEAKRIGWIENEALVNHEANRQQVMAYDSVPVSHEPSKGTMRALSPGVPMPLGVSGESAQAVGGTCTFGQPNYGASCQHTNGTVAVLAGLSGGVLGVHGNTFGLLGSFAYGVVGQHPDGHFGRLGTPFEGVYGQHPDGNFGRIGTPSEGVYGENANGTFGQLGGESWGTYGLNANDNFGFLASGVGAYGEHANGPYGLLGSLLGYGTLGVNGDGVYTGHLGRSLDGVEGKHFINNSYSIYGAIGGEDYGAWGINPNVYTNEGYLGHDSYGVWGKGALWAGHFQGDVQVTGTLTESAAASKIDHPLDPANRYLSHSFVESPDMMTVYTGTIVTDENGEAVVELPSYFEALNRDFRYGLTVLGTFARAIVAEKIQDNRFVIRTDAPGVEVSWQVTGIRHDPWAEAHRIVVEEAKPADERGFYLHPALYGQPEERSVAWVRDPEGIRAVEEMPARLEAEHRRLEQERQRLDEEHQRMRQAHPRQ